MNNIAGKIQKPSVFGRILLKLKGKQNISLISAALSGLFKVLSVSGILKYGFFRIEGGFSVSQATLLSNDMDYNLSHKKKTNLLAK